MALLADFKAAAVGRTRFPDDVLLTPAAIFALVRDMPYERAADLEPATTVREWRATCTGKHALLHALYRDFGLRSILIHAMHHFTLEGTSWAPPDLRELLADGPIPDVHTFLRLEQHGQWMTVDATWPLAARRLGLPANERFEPGRDMTVACDPEEIVHVPGDSDVGELKALLLERHVGDQRPRREAFLGGLRQWLARELGRVEASR